MLWTVFSCQKAFILSAGALVFQNLNMQLIYLYLYYIFKENTVPRSFMIIWIKISDFSMMVLLL